jgi:hypothetical protein
MKFLLFKGDNYYPSGGWDDFVGAYETLEAAKMAATDCDWAQVVDAVALCEVAKYGYFGKGPQQWIEPRLVL